jgi:hypothetical protein
MIKRKRLFALFFGIAAFGQTASAQLSGKATAPEKMMPPEKAQKTHCAGPGKKGAPMALDTNTFLMVLAAAIMVMGVVVWAMFKKAS